jgi:hypothetical protein
VHRILDGWELIFRVFLPVIPEKNLSEEERAPFPRVRFRLCTHNTAVRVFRPGFPSSFLASSSDILRRTHGVVHLGSALQPSLLFVGLQFIHIFDQAMEPNPLSSPQMSMVFARLANVKVIHQQDAAC